MSDERTKLNDFPERARRLQEHLGLTQRKMAERFGITRSYYAELVSPNSTRSPGLALEQMLLMMERLNALEEVLSDDNKSRSRDWGEVREDGPRYGSSLPSKPQLNTSSGRLTPEMILNPAYSSDGNNLGKTANEIVQHLRPWLSAAENQPQIAHYFLSQLQLELPLSKLKKLEEHS